MSVRETWKALWLRQSPSWGQGALVSVPFTRRHSWAWSERTGLAVKTCFPAGEQGAGGGAPRVAAVLEAHARPLDLVAGWLGAGWTRHIKEEE